MFARRRPVLRAAAVGGGAYVAGKKKAQRSAQEAEQTADQDARISALESQQQAGGAASPAPASQAASPSMSDQLKQLNELHQQGALTDEEFAAAKSKLLGG